MKNLYSSRMGRLLIFTGFLFLSACADEEPVTTEEVARPVKLLTIEGSGSAGTRDFPGTVRASLSAEMAFEVAGRITEFLVTESQEVLAGTELAKLDPRDYQSAYDQALASYNRAVSELNRSERIYQQDSGAISTSAIESSQESVQVAQAILQQAQKALDDTVLRAPFDGLVARRMVEDFETVNAQQPVLLVQNISSLEIEAAVPERFVAEIGQRPTPQQATVRFEPRIRITSLPDYEFPAQITEFATTADPATRSFRSRMRFETPDSINVLPGMTARVLINDIGTGSISLPSHATFADESANANVWVVDPESMRVTKRLVTLGALSEDQIEIVSGLEYGEIVAVSGVNQLREQMQVRGLEL